MDSEHGTRLESFSAKRTALFEQIYSTRNRQDQISPSLSAYTIDKGGFIVPFRAKVERGFKEWENGTRIFSHFIVSSVEEDTATLTVVSPIPNHFDKFILHGLDKLELELLKNLGLAEIQAVIRVTSKQPSNQELYDAQLITIVGIQEPFDGNYDKLEENAHVLIEGTVIAYKKGPHTYDNTKKSGTCLIQISNGIEISVLLTDGHLSFASDTHDDYFKLYDKNPELGDIIQLQATFGNPVASFHTPAPNQLFSFAGSVQLLDPSEKRVFQFETDRETVQEATAALQDADSYSGARTIVADLIRSTPLLPKERDLIWRNIQQIIPEEKERPLYLFSRVDQVNALQQMYGEDVLSMSQRQFLKFCLGIPRKTDAFKRSGQADLHFGLLNQFEDSERLQVFLETAQNLYKKVNGRVVLDVGVSNLNTLSQDQVSPHYHQLFVSSLEHLSSFPNQEVATLFIQILDDMYKRSQLRSPEEYDKGREFNESVIFRNTIKNVLQHITHTKDEIIGIENEAIVQMYLDQLSMLKNLSWVLAGIKRNTKQLQALINLLEQVKMFQNSS